MACTIKSFPDIVDDDHHAGWYELSDTQEVTITAFKQMRVSGTFTNNGTLINNGMMVVD